MPQPAKVLERRQTQRIAVALPVVLGNGKGVTRDVSASGVFFETDVFLSPGVPISFCLLLEQVDPIGPLQIHCRGDIVRVERRQGTVGVAIAVASHRLEPSSPSRTRGSPHREGDGLTARRSRRGRNEMSPSHSRHG